MLATLSLRTSLVFTEKLVDFAGWLGGVRKSALIRLGLFYSLLENCLCFLIDKARSSEGLDCLFDP